MTTNGNVDVGIFSNDNIVTFNNDSFNELFIPNIFIGQGQSSLTDNDGNTIDATNRDFLVNQTSFGLYISGNGNGYYLDTTGLASALVDIEGNGNEVDGQNTVYDADFTLRLTGDYNLVEFVEVFSDGNTADLGIVVSGNFNNLTLASTSNEINTSSFHVEGNRNIFSYDLAAGVDHTTVGSDFGATFTAASTGGGRSYYNLAMDAFGTGFTKFTTGASSMVITGDCSYSEDINGNGSCS